MNPGHDKSIKTSSSSSSSSSSSAPVAILLKLAHWKFAPSYSPGGNSTQARNWLVNPFGGEGLNPEEKRDFGLPLPCAATVRSLTHLISLTNYEERKIAGGVQRFASGVIEKRWTHLMIHVLIACSNPWIFWKIQWRHYRKSMDIYLRTPGQSIENL